MKEQKPPLNLKKQKREIMNNNAMISQPTPLGQFKANFSRLSKTHKIYRKPLKACKFKNLQAFLFFLQPSKF
jgi:hypothetical protein